MKQLFIGIMLLLAGGEALSAEPQRYPGVVSAKVQPRAPDTFDLDVTVSSPYDTPARYADGPREHHDVVVAHDDELRAAAPDLPLLVSSSLR